MNDRHVRQRFLEILTQVFHVNPNSVSDAATLEELGLDSLAQVELSDRLQEVFAVEVSDDEVASAATVHGVVALLDLKTVDTP